MRYISKNGRRIMLPDSNKDDWKTRKNMTHTHDEEAPNFENMTKKALGEWAKKNNITVDSKKTKASMIGEITKQL